MPTDYDAIRCENLEEYGKGIARFGRRLLAERYDGRTHFILELLQNAEDALRRRTTDGPRAVRFTLTGTELRFSHYGALFDEEDVRSICGIALSTKEGDTSAIGRFGIGFKAVYAFTDAPEIHSGDEHFAIDQFVHPRAIVPIVGEPNQTEFRFPFRQGDPHAQRDIAKGLSELGPRTLLFLREIEEIAWTIDGAPARRLQRRSTDLRKTVRRVTLEAGDEGAANERERWLVFEKPSRPAHGSWSRPVEIAFRYDKTGKKLEPVADSKLVVYFPTIVSTHLGFLVQGPYQTTTSRDNVPHEDAWNKHLVSVTAELLIEALHYLRDQELLTVEALQTLPIDRLRFLGQSLFAPLFDRVRDELFNERLLPAQHGRYEAGKNAMLARTADVRELIGAQQLGQLLGAGHPVNWLRDEITQGKTAQLRHYLMAFLSVQEMDAGDVIARMDASFLEAQSDTWVAKLYSFLSRQPALTREPKFRERPLIRLEGGRHVAAIINGQPQAFLPGALPTEFPTVAKAVCADPAALHFLQSVGLSEPDPVDDVVQHILGRYAVPILGNPPPEYEADFKRIVAAAATDSKKQRDKLFGALRDAHFVCAVDAATGQRQLCRPIKLYYPTENLRTLFAGVKGILLVDDRQAGQEFGDFLASVGTHRLLERIPSSRPQTADQRAELRTAKGALNFTRDYEQNYVLRGVPEVLAAMAQLSSSEQAVRAVKLWEALTSVAEQRGMGDFEGQYSWHFGHRSYSVAFDSETLTLLQQEAWVPWRGQLVKPAQIEFDDVLPAWKPHPVLVARIGFKPPVLAALAREAGFDPALIGLLKELGLTSARELMARLGILEKTADANGTNGNGSPPAPTPNFIRTAKSNGDCGGNYEAGERTGSGGRSRSNHAAPSADAPASNANETTTPARDFMTYVSVAGAEGSEADSEPADNHIVETKAINWIIALEPTLKRTPTNNRGFDLFEGEALDTADRWVEVKSCSGPWSSPVVLSRSQFEEAQRRGPNYWLYVVECVDDPVRTTVYRIPNPAGDARFFKFDPGWRHLTCPLAQA